MVLTGSSTREQLVAIIEPAARGLLLDWELRDLGTRLKVLIAVSKFGHCLVDLIHKREIGQLPIDIVGVVSNHEAMRKTVEWHGLPYHHLPMYQGQPAQEETFLSLIASTGAELSVLARSLRSEAHTSELQSL